MEIVNWKGITESLLFAAGDEGLSLKQIAEVLEMDESQAETILQELIQSCEDDYTRGITVAQFAGTYQLVTKKENSDYLKKLVETPGTGSLSQAALETLAIIAYKQPITRVEIEEIRGVKTERPLHTLAAKALIKEAGRAEGAGRAYLYATTKEFLDYFGLKSIDELPPLTENDEDEYAGDEADLFFEKFQETLDN
ncbi:MULTISPECIES: SMC-Scp complex subunit ScpB [Bacillus]|uniref:Segregation and condensation protein B n=1 Tax=Bacillus infantis TaxID=324767 RepID=A0A5D4SXI5_9BACI|nr:MULTISPECIES: SMC-Scp complex subunit ScpB [Bacillus]MCK6204573.1 SMC-Scp complex subunit ScpB [Bacillus infantis]MDT0160079.1 SMC-Scp complex subunit ScpB [Bacillus sp. AG4(2022)]OXT19254.1 SMC-Scp complex subunit ScpB [Bacillus sp. OG2]TYS66506.1 SMC-Scp complex subunit ScpB [Bacillus infantis]